MCVETYKLSIYGKIYTSEVNGPIENLNEALASGYARSRQRLKGGREWNSCTHPHVRVCTFRMLV